jgi:hypothetical protein
MNTRQQELTFGDTERPKEYMKGPDVMSKSKRTQRHHRKANRNQTHLDNFGFSISCPPATHTRNALPNQVMVHQKSPDIEIEAVQPAIWDETVEVEIPPQIREESVEVTIPSPPDREDESGGAQGKHGWEDDLDECIQAGVEIRSWEDLRKQIKEELQKGSKTLPLSKINQLLVLRNFATLQLKGFSKTAGSILVATQWHEGEGTYYARKVRALARHYQVFEQLPREKRGGEKMCRSLLLDERVKTAARGWLVAQKAGEVTPRRFQHALNTEILPTINIMMNRPLCERTARRWLLKLGWHLRALKKGIYMDGHEREDVMKYRNEVFLPAMARFEAKMTHFEGPELKKVSPTLKDGEKEIIPQFHDESCLTVNDYKSTAWLGPGQKILQKKGRGRLIHVSEFINPLTGRLVLHDKDGNIVDEARKIIYPGSNGDPWWDTDQLLTQVKHAIQVFEKAHPNCVALFIFDQSSAHASLGPNALKASEMNKSDGGKQRIQRDTIIPDSNPSPACQGMEQKMTLPDGRPKGLERVLTECGFDVKGMRAKCAPVCPFENTGCCMMRLLSKQADFLNQESMLETIIKSSGHECIFLPKFHCELNPIEMVSACFIC